MGDVQQWVRGERVCLTLLMEVEVGEFSGDVDIERVARREMWWQCWVFVRWRVDGAAAMRRRRR